MMIREFAQAMSITYYKRLRMERELREPPYEMAGLPEPYRWVPWTDELIDLHAEVNYLSFRHELDSHVFPCLGDREGCRRLLREIRRKPGFLGDATWLAVGPAGCVGTIQGIVDRGHIGSIQNVGVIPGYRGLGIGRALVGRALLGFYQSGLRKVYLEVTAQNEGAVRLYQHLGFQRSKTLYKAVAD